MFRQQHHCVAGLRFLWYSIMLAVKHLVKEVKKRKKHVTQTTGELTYACVCVECFLRTESKSISSTRLSSWFLSVLCGSIVSKHIKTPARPCPAPMTLPFDLYHVFFSWTINKWKHSRAGKCNRRHVAHPDTTLVHFLTSSTVSGSGAVSPKSGN